MVDPGLPGIPGSQAEFYQASPLSDHKQAALKSMQSFCFTKRKLRHGELIHVTTLGRGRAGPDPGPGMLNPVSCLPVFSFSLPTACLPGPGT